MEYALCVKLKSGLWAPLDFFDDKAEANAVAEALKKIPLPKGHRPLELEVIEAGLVKSAPVISIEVVIGRRL